MKGISAINPTSHDAAAPAPPSQPPTALHNAPKLIAYNVACSEIEQRNYKDA
jgi:hypothetical protein